MNDAMFAELVDSIMFYFKRRGVVPPYVALGEEEWRQIGTELWWISHMARVQIYGVPIKRLRDL